MIALVSAGIFALIAGEGDIAPRQRPAFSR